MDVPGWGYLSSIILLEKDSISRRRKYLSPRFINHCYLFLSSRDQDKYINDSHSVFSSCHKIIFFPPENWPAFSSIMCGWQTHILTFYSKQPQDDCMWDAISQVILEWGFLLVYASFIKKKVYSFHNKIIMGLLNTVGNTDKTKNK